MLRLLTFCLDNFCNVYNILHTLITNGFKFCALYSSINVNTRARFEKMATKNANMCRTNQAGASAHNSLIFIISCTKKKEKKTH